MKPKDGAKIIIVSPDKILLFHRDNIPTIPYPNCWHLVGGGIEESETPEEGLIREVKEEVSYDLAEFKLISKTKAMTTGGNVWLYTTFVGKEDEKKFKHGPGEGQEIGWFTIDEALALNLTPGTRVLLSKQRDMVENMMKATHI